MRLVRDPRWLVVAACLTTGCADILGIDDGTPRVEAGVVDAAKPDVFSPLHCGNTTCNFAALEGCCADDDSGAQTCASATTTCSGLFIPCDRASQCEQSGDAGPIVCCADYEVQEAGVIATGVSCVPASDCNASNARFALCGGDGGTCQGDASCGVSSLSLPSYLVCLGDGVQ